VFYFSKIEIIGGFPLKGGNITSLNLGRCLYARNFRVFSDYDQITSKTHVLAGQVLHFVTA
jgi:hypothetical protein